MLLLSMLDNDKVISIFINFLLRVKISFSLYFEVSIKYSVIYCISYVKAYYNILSRYDL